MGTIAAFPPMSKPFDPREQAVQPEGALPSEPQYDMPTEEQWQRLEGIEATRRLCEQYGYARIGRWVRNLASLEGRAVDENIERPADRCLADGAVLINSICVQCGRDNS